jgi:hypothetical protein
LFNKVLTHFNDDDIEQFRVELKKLRAFLHLLDMETGEGIQLKMTPNMKTFYGYAGIIRNLNLFLHTINKHFASSTDKDLSAYITKLEKEILYWQKNTNAHVDMHRNFSMDQEKIIAKLPAKLKRRSIKKFVEYVNYELQILLMRFDDEKLHSIRKLLEDILYNWKYLQPYAGVLPTGLSHKEDIRSILNSLLDFKDKCVANTLLDTYYNDAESDEEKIILTNIMQFCKSQKNDLKKEICSKLELIPVQPIIKRTFSL